MGIVVQYHKVIRIHWWGHRRNYYVAIGDNENQLTCYPISRERFDLALDAKIGCLSRNNYQIKFFEAISTKRMKKLNSRYNETNL